MPGRVWELKPSDKSESGAPIPPKVGGDPDALGPLAWPPCAQCGKPMRFLFQLAHHPTRLDLAPYTSIHVFQCENPDTACESFDPDSGANRVVGVIAGRPHDIQGAPPDRTPAPEVFIAAAPAEEDTAVLSIDVDNAPFEALGEYDRAAAAAPSSKVGGVPVWVQGDGTPTCSGERMEFLAQLYGATWGLQFGDDGTGYVFRCAKRCEAPFKFLWQAG